MLALNVKNLSKSYGKIKAVNNVSFEVKEGEIFGLIGPNGAGKSTTLKIISTLLSFDEGNVTVFGEDLAKKKTKIRSLISYLPEDAGAYKNLSGLYYLDFMISFFAKSKKEKEELLEKAKEMTGLGDRLKDKVSNYSKGMMRRLLITRALIVPTKLCILDEPTSGLDVINSIHVRDTIKEFKDRTFLISSHNMLEIEYLCDRIALIDQGKIVEAGTPKELKDKYKAQNIEDVFKQIVLNEK